MSKSKHLSKLTKVLSKSSIATKAMMQGLSNSMKNSDMQILPNKSIVQEKKFFEQANDLINNFIAEPTPIYNSFIGSKYKRDEKGEILFNPETHEPILEEAEPVGMMYADRIIYNDGRVEMLEEEEELERDANLIHKYIQKLAKEAKEKTGIADYIVGIDPYRTEDK